MSKPESKESRAIDSSDSQTEIQSMKMKTEINLKWKKCMVMKDFVDHVFRHNRRLKKLTIEGIMPYHQSFGKELCVNTTLTELSLTFNLQMGVVFATALASALRVNRTLTKLELSSSNIGDEGARDLADALRVNTSLKTLVLDKNYIEEEGGTDLASALRVNTSLTSLELSYNVIRDAGAIALASALRVNTSLTLLNLGQNHIEVAGATDLAAALHVNRSLTLLNLGQNRIREEGGIVLAAALHVNRSLKYLDLNGNEIRDAGATALAGALRVNTSLKTLDLSYNDIGQAGAEELASAILERKTPIYLIISNISNKSKEGSALKKAVRNQTRTNPKVTTNMGQENRAHKFLSGSVFGHGEEVDPFLTIPESKVLGLTSFAAQQCTNLPTSVVNFYEGDYKGAFTPLKKSKKVKRSKKSTSAKRSKTKKRSKSKFD